MIRRIDEKTRQRGQALLMATVAGISMCGLLGLAVDLGWSYFVKKQAQAAADAAALAAVEQAFANVGPKGPFACGSGLTCQSAAPCPSAGNLQVGCLYAQQNGFTSGGHGGCQTVTIMAGTDPNPPTAPGVFAHYWATVTINENIPQLFSAVLGNRMGISGARATAALADTLLVGNIWSLNREHDPGPYGTGVGIFVRGNGVVRAAGIFVASALPQMKDGSAGSIIDGTSGIQDSFAEIREGGQVGGNHPELWVPPPVNGIPDGSNFLDPMRGLGQPSAPSGLPPIPVPGGTIGPLNGETCRNLTPGSYYATTTISCGTGCTQVVPSGRPITFNGCVNFTPGNSNFGSYAFFGGMYFDSGTFKFYPGKYFLAGALPGNSIWAQGTNATITDLTPLDASGNAQYPTANNAGEIFVMTNLNYPGLQVPTELANSTLAPTMSFGPVQIQMGNSGDSYINLHGLNKKASAPPPEELIPYAPTLMWQDQQNSTIVYNADGTINTNCGSMLDPCTRSATGLAPNWNIQADSRLHLWGLFYQPRGASLTMQGLGNSGIYTPMQVITGSFSSQGGGDMSVFPLGSPFTRRTVSLVE